MNMLPAQRLLPALFLALLLLAAGCTEEQPASDGTPTQAETSGDTMQSHMQNQGGMGMMGEGYVPDSLAQMKLAPLVKAYHQGGEAFFIHTEVSDSSIARTLTEMMGPGVVVMPKLAQAPAALTAPIYVFENGMDGMGPLGHQPDILGTVPGHEEYSPLRRIHLVSWNESATPRKLKSEDALMQVQRQGQLSIEESGIVSTPPCWPGPPGIGKPAARPALPP